MVFLKLISAISTFLFRSFLLGLKSKLIMKKKLILVQQRWSSPILFAHAIKFKGLVMAV
jgi:hypothetical protein